MTAPKTKAAPARLRKRKVTTDHLPHLFTIVVNGGIVAPAYPEGSVLVCTPPPTDRPYGGSETLVFRRPHPQGRNEIVVGPATSALEVKKADHIGMVVGVYHPEGRSPFIPPAEYLTRPAKRPERLRRV